MIKIYTVSDKRPDFIIWQKRCFEKFLQDDYEFIVCNNAESKKNAESIQLICQNEKLKCILIPTQRHENPNIACSYPLDYLTQEVLTKEREAILSIFIDSDMFLIKDFSFFSYMEEYDIAAVFQSRGNYGYNTKENHVHYFWNALVCFNHKRIKNLDQIIWADSASQLSPYFPFHLYDNKYSKIALILAKLFLQNKILAKIKRYFSLAPALIEGVSVDVGGPTFFYLKNVNPEVKYIDFHRVQVENDNINEFIPLQLQDIYKPFYNDAYASDFLISKHIFHYRAGSNWNGMTNELIQQKSIFFEKIMELVFEGKWK